MRYYAKVSPHEETETVRNSFKNAGIDVNDIIVDDEVQQKKQGSTYNSLKKELLLTRESLTIDSMFSLGKNAREVTKELEWFEENGIGLYILDMPSTMKEDASTVEIMHDVNAQYAEREITKLKEGQKKSVKVAKKEGREIKHSTGRKKIPYPATWDAEYTLWKKKEITSAEFMGRVGLSQGTFYNLLRQYKEDLLKKEKGEGRSEEREA